MHRPGRAIGERPILYESQAAHVGDIDANNCDSYPGAKPAHRSSHDWLIRAMILTAQITRERRVR